MARRPKSLTPKAEISSGLLDALKFCKLVTKSEGPPSETHVLLSNHSAIAFNGILAVGQHIAEDIYCAPNADLMASALAKCGEQFSITQLDNNRLSIKSNKFKALVPCIDPQIIYPAAPDAPQAVIDDRFKEAMAAVCGLASDTAQSVVAASILMAGASLIATDRKVMMEFWHGSDLPYGIPLPKTFGQVLTKINKKLTRFGFNQSSCTFYFEDDSWIRSQFFAEPWPDVRSILDRSCNAWPVPNDFWKALDAVAPFSDDENIFFDTGIMRSHPDEGVGASFEVYGLPKGLIFSIKQLNYIRSYAEQIDFAAPGVYDMLMWFGKNCRGAIAGRKVE